LWAPGLVKVENFGQLKQPEWSKFLKDLAAVTGVQLSLYGYSN